MNKKQTVYIPTKVENELPNNSCKCGIIKKGVFDLSYFIKAPSYQVFDHVKSGLHHNQSEITHWLKPTEAYVFTPEELKQLLEEYTNRIVENTKLKTTYIDEVYDSNFKDTALPNEEIFLITDNDGMPYAANKVAINKESITSQLPKFLKEKGI